MRTTPPPPIRAESPEIRPFGADVGPAPADRRRWLLSAADADLQAWFAALRECSREPAVSHGEQLATFLGVPHGEVVASPLGFRACALAAAQGVAFTHLELRPQWRWDPALLPEQGADDEDHGQWVKGALWTGRFEGFCQDEPFGGFNPNHSSRWTPHEALHRVIGFAWWPQMSRWDLYHAARLGEIVPVAHWYGSDLVHRLDHTAFDRHSDAADPGATLERALWLRTGEDAAAPTADAWNVDGLRVAARWIDAELAAITTERTTGQRVAVADALLDSVSDATAYTAGHHRRLGHPMVTAALETATVAGVHRFASLPAYQAQLEAVFDALVFGEITVDPAVAVARRAGRSIWDLVLRAAHCDPISYNEALADLLPSVAATTRACADGNDSDAAALFARLCGALRDAALDDVMPLGLTTAIEPTERIDFSQLAAGVQSVAPDLAAAAREAGASIEAMVADWPIDGWFIRAPLATRLVAATAGSELHTEAMIAEAVAGSTTRDDHIERLSAPVDQVMRAVAALVVTSDVGETTRFVVRRSDAFRPLAQPADLLVGNVWGEIVAVPMPPALRKLWQLLAPCPLALTDVVTSLERLLIEQPVAPPLPGTTEAWLREWLDAGVIGAVAVAPAE